jgi:hypothetical protein
MYLPKVEWVELPYPLPPVAYRNLPLCQGFGGDAFGQSRKRKRPASIEAGRWRDLRDEFGLG